MGNRIESFRDIEEGHRKYLFFKDDELHAGTENEDHTSILQGSRRNLTEVRVAGSYLRTYDTLVVGGRGSHSLNVENCDPAPVVNYIKSFPDSARKTIITP